MALKIKVYGSGIWLREMYRSGIWLRGKIFSMPNQQLNFMAEVQPVAMERREASMM